MATSSMASGPPASHYHDFNERHTMKESLIRTLVPIIVTLLARAGFKELGVDDATIATLAAGLAAWLYYFGVRVLERASSSKWGWLLGYPSAPVYAGKHEAV